MDDPLAHLQERITKYKKRHLQRPDYTSRSNVSASSIAIEMVAAVLSGIILGVILDKIFDTKLIFKIICVILSCVANFYSMYKQTQRR